MVAESWDIEAGFFDSIDQESSLGHRDINVVDLELDQFFLGGGKGLVESVSNFELVDESLDRLFSEHFFLLFAEIDSFY